MVVDETGVVEAVTVGREDVGADGNLIVRRLGALHHRVLVAWRTEMHAFGGGMPVVGIHGRLVEGDAFQRNALRDLEQ